MRSNHEYDYFDNVTEYEYDYLAFWTNVIEYGNSESRSTIIEYDYYISLTCAKSGNLASVT